MPRRPAQALIVPLSALVLSASPSLAQERYRLVILPPADGHTSAFPTDMNEQGLIVGYAGIEPLDPTADPIAVNTATQQVFIAPSATDSSNFPLGIGTPALVAGTTLYQPCAWVRGVPRILRPAGGLPSGFANDANASGVIVGVTYNDFTGRQFPAAWPNAAAYGVHLTGLGGSRNGVCHAINENNQIAGVIEGIGGFGFVGVRWDDPFAAPLPVAPLAGGINSEVIAINEMGDLAGRTSFADFSIEAIAMFADQGTTVALGGLGGTYSFAHDLNDLRQIVGVANTPELEGHGFLWQDGVLSDLNDLIDEANGEYDYVGSAVAIDNQGRIAVEVVVESSFPQVHRIGFLVPIR